MPLCKTYACCYVTNSCSLVQQIAISDYISNKWVEKHTALWYRAEERQAGQIILLLKRLATIEIQFSKYYYYVPKSSATLCNNSNEFILSFTK